MQAIQTKYHGPTNHKGARMSSRSAGGVFWHSYEYAANIERNHELAAAEHMARRGWGDRYTTTAGQLPDGTYAHVLTDNEVRT